METTNENNDNLKEEVFQMPPDLENMSELCDLLANLTHNNCKKTVADIVARYDTPETIDLVASALTYFFEIRITQRNLYTILGSNLLKQFKNYLWASVIFIGSGSLLYNLYKYNALTLQQIRQRCQIDKQIYYFFAPELGIPHYYQAFSDIFELIPVTDNTVRDDSETNCVDVMKEELKENNWAKYDELRTTGYLSSSIQHLIIRDDLQEFTLRSNMKGFETNLVFDESPFIGHQKFSYISFAARYGAKECFWLLKKKNCPIDNNVVLNAVFGGNMEIIQECYSENASFEGALSIAIASHRNEVIDFIKLNFPQYTYTPEDCITGFNLGAFGGSTLEFSPLCLHYSALTGYVPLVHFFLMQDLDINALDQNHETSLILASRMGFYEMVYYLIKAGADPNIKGKRGETPLYIACLIGMVEMGNLLLNESADPSIRTDYNENTLNAVAFSGVTNLCDSLLGFDLNINQENPPLVTAIKDGRLNMVHYFLSKGAVPNIRFGPKQDTPLHIAVNKLDFRFCRELISFNANPTLENADKISPLMISFIRGDSRITKLFISGNSNVNVNQVFSDGKTLMHYAAQSESKINQSVVLKHQSELSNEENKNSNQQKRKWNETKFINEGITFLYRCGLDINKADYDEKTPLFYAIEYKQYSTMYFLIELNANVNVKAIHGNTPLHICARDGAVQAMEILINHGALINEINNDSKTPLDLASEEGHVDAIVTLLSHGAMFTTPYSVTTCVHLAAARNQSEVVQFFLTCNFEQDGKVTTFDTELRNDERETILHVAAKNGAKETVAVLLENGADTNAEDDKGDSPLALAAYNNYPDIADMLLEKDSDPNTRNSKGDPLLFWCIKNNKQEIIASLVSHGADVNIQDLSGDFPLHVAVSQNTPRWIRFLHKFNVEMDPLDANGKTPLIIACEKSLTDCVEALVECGANVHFQRKDDGSTPLHIAVKKRKLNIMKILVYSNADPCAKDNEGLSPIDLVSETQELPFIDMCLLNGYDINRKIDSDENTHLHYAVFSDDIEKVDFYIKRHADINCVDSSNRSPLYHAILKNNPMIVLYLLEHDADRTISTNDGKTPLTAALESGSYVLVRLLQKTYIPDIQKYPSFKDYEKNIPQIDKEIQKYQNQLEKELNDVKKKVEYSEDNSDFEEEEDINGIPVKAKGRLLNIDDIDFDNQENGKKKKGNKLEEIIKNTEDIEDEDENENYFLKRGKRKGKTEKYIEFQREREKEKIRKIEQKKLLKLETRQRKKAEKRKQKYLAEITRLQSAKVPEFDDEEEDNDEKPVVVAPKPIRKKLAYDENSDLRPYGFRNSTYGTYDFMKKLIIFIVIFIIILYVTKS